MNCFVDCPCLKFQCRQTGSEEMRMEFKRLSFEIVENLTNIKPRLDINKAIVCCVTNDFPREVRNTISEHFRGGTEVVSDI